jgi:hypothetical protein
LRPHLVDEDDGGSQSYGAHQGPQHPENRRLHSTLQTTFISQHVSSLASV